MLLLHGNSGAGKSLYCALLEQQLWSEYRRGGLAPLLVSLPSASEPDASAVADALAERCGATLRECASDGRPWLVVLDGYDEVRGCTNFIVGNQLASLLPNAKVIITCRTEYLESLPNYAALFDPRDGSAVSQLFVRSFKSTDMAMYFDKFVEHRASRQAASSQSTPVGPLWSAQQYKQAVEQNPSIQLLARSPFVLRVLADALPLLYGDTAGTGGRRITEADVFESFLSAWYAREAARLRVKPIPGLPPDFDGPRSFDAYGRDLAVEMLSRSALAVDSVAGVYVVGGTGNSVWARFFAADAVTQAACRGVPLRRAGRSTSFIHKSIAEYFAAMAMWMDITAASAVSTSATAGGGGDGSTAPTATTVPAACALNRIQVHKQPAVLRFLVAKFRGLPLTSNDGDGTPTQQLVSNRMKDVVKASAIHPVTSTAAANCASVLAQAGVSLAGVSWRGARLPHAVLSSAVLSCADLRDADLQHCILHKAVLDGVCFAGANMQGVQVGKMPHLKGHANFTHGVAFSPNGTQLASASFDCTIMLWDVATSELQATLVGHGQAVTGVSYSPDGKRLVSGCRDGNLKVWDTVTHACVGTVLHQGGRVYGVCWSPAGDYIASVAWNSSHDPVCLWNAATLELSKALPEATPSIGVCFSPDAQRVVVGGADHCVRVWDVATATLLATLSHHSNYVYNVAYSPDGRFFASASWDHTAVVWDAKTLAVHKVLAEAADIVNDVCLSPDGLQLATAAGQNTFTDSSVRVYDTVSGTMLAKHDGHVRGVIAVAQSPDGKLLANGGYDSHVRVWDAGSTSTSLMKTVDGPTDRVMRVAWSQDGHMLATCSLGGTIRFWDAVWGCGTALGVIDVGSPVNGGAFAAAGSQFVSHNGNDVCVWDVSTGQAVMTLAGHTAEVLFVAVSPDGTVIASSSKDTTIRLWDSSTGVLLRVLEGHAGNVECVVFSRDGLLLASSASTAGTTSRVWDVSTGEQKSLVRDEASGDSYMCFFSPDSKILGVGSYRKRVQLWDVTQPTAKSIGVLPGHESTS